MKQLLTIAALLLSLAACGQNTNKNMNNQKTLVAYFSWSNNTEVAAKHIAEARYRNPNVSLNDIIRSNRQ